MKQDKHISSSFKTPKDYFKNFEVNPTSALSRKANHGFKTPESYFETLSVNIPKEPVKVVSIFRRKILISITSVAAVFALVFTFYKKQSPLTINDISTNTLQDYVLNFTSDEDYTDLIEETNITSNTFLELSNYEVNELVDDLELNDLLN